MLDFNYYPKPEHIKAAYRLQQEQLLEYCEMIADANDLLWELMFYINEDGETVSHITGRIQEAKK